MAEHFIEKCRDCQSVIAQCRCPGPKLVKWGLCDACKQQRDQRNLDELVGFSTLGVSVFK